MTENLLVTFEGARKHPGRDHNSDIRAATFRADLERLALFEPDRDAFIREAFKRGCGDGFRLNDETVRRIALRILHTDYGRPQHGRAADQAVYEDSIRRRDEASLPTSLEQAIDFLLRQGDAARLKTFIEQQPRRYHQHIRRHVEGKRQNGHHRG